MDHADLIGELPVIEKLTPAERIAIARQRRAFQLLKWQEREKAAEALSNASVDGVAVHTLYERKPKIAFNSSITLLEATARNDMEEVVRLLKAGADPNSHNEDGLTPLHQCAIDNNEPMLQLLLEKGADSNARDTELWTPLHAAACCGHAEIVRHLIDRGARLLAVNADGNMPYDICDDEYTLDLIESEMAKRGITQEDIDDERVSNERRMLEDIQDLHDAGGDLEYRDENGATPLHIACANGFYNCAQFLLDCGCSPHVRDNDGWQPVHAAACWAQADILELLVAYGADMNVCTPLNETPLDLCEDEGVRAVIMTLQVELQRRKLLSFGRDSRRMSKRRKPTSKFESPPSANQFGGPENHLASTRGAIRRLSIRDRAGVTLARLEARKEAALMRSFSFEENSNPMLSKQEASLDLTNEPSEKRPVSCPEVSSMFDGKSSVQGDKTIVNGLDECDSVQQSSTTVEMVTVSGVSGQLEEQRRTDQSSSAQVAETKKDMSESKASEENVQGNQPTQEISATEWLQKVMKEEEQGMINPLERGSVSSGRKARSKSPAPTAPLSTTPNGIAATNLRNGQVSHDRQHSADSMSGGRVQRSAMTEMYMSQQHTRTLVPGEPSFSRHPMTLIDLKKQRVEDRKTSPIPRSPIPTDSNASSAPMISIPAGDSTETAKARYRAPSDAVVGRSSPRSRSPKLGMRCCTIT